MTITQKRAKYTSDELTALGEKGHAFRNTDGAYAFAIVDTDDLKDAIRNVGRGDATDDAARKFTAGRADALSERDLVPDNWNADGSLKEQRDTANDVFAALDGAVSDMVGDNYYCWVQDWYGDETDGWTVIYYCSGDLWSAPFEYDADQKVVLGDAVKVRPVTSYVPRSGGPVLEWRKRKVEEMRGLERRTLNTSDAIEIREADDGSVNLVGYASVTERAYDVGFYEETIKRGAFKRTLGDNPDVVLLLNHGGLPLARTKSGTLTLSEDEHGLRVEASLDGDDPDTRALIAKRSRGDLDGQMSFAFQVTGQSWTEDYSQRTITGVSLHRGDVSVVTHGSNPATSSSIRAQTAAVELRAAGGATAVIAALAEWRDFTLQPLEARAGKALSAATMTTLTNVLSLISTADEAVDEAQPMLAELMGVPNPDVDDNEPDPGETGDVARSVTRLPDYTTEAAETLAILRAKGAN